MTTFQERVSASIAKLISQANLLRHIDADPIQRLRVNFALFDLQKHFPQQEMELSESKPELLPELQIHYFGEPTEAESAELTVTAEVEATSVPESAPEQVENIPIESATESNPKAEPIEKSEKSVDFRLPLPVPTETRIVTTVSQRLKPIAIDEANKTDDDIETPPVTERSEAVKAETAPVETELDGGSAAEATFREEEEEEATESVTGSDRSSIDRCGPERSNNVQESALVESTVVKATISKIDTNCTTEVEPANENGGKRRRRRNRN